MSKRTLAILLCGALALSACTSSTREGPLTATDALGDLKTIDYCTVIGESGDSAFEHCRIANGVKIMAVGPVESGENKDLYPVEYHGSAMPEGMRVQGSTFNSKQSCTRLLTFSDDVRLRFLVTGEANDEANCAKAMEFVESALGVINENKVGRRQFADNSFGRLDPCALLSTPEVEAVLGKDRKKTPGITGHNCLFGDVALTFDQKQAVVGDEETIAGYQATVSKISLFCTVHLNSGDESAAVKAISITGEADDSTCDKARQVAELVFPTLPKP
ncbi:DUF3558 domain-containing protein [Umezawaea endophytica]|uniref:DUF3558 domain-containing protein n=1 Tax=Umezawaea endophytica TaxID=1654476 RepID=A0A9X2VNA6_9PSEU|nr:DUF3558 domain-containing protein [Umezawaea endophytica]MCS7479841.1 DUF3558 domain-containing protein [Umezawaea endophytica]